MEAIGLLLATQKSSNSHDDSTLIVCLSEFNFVEVPWTALSVQNMSSRRLRGGKASRWDREESSWDRVHHVAEHQLPRKGPAGLIFMCSSKTKRDCFYYKVLGLPLAKKDLVEQIVPGVFLFLFDIEMRELYGIYEASSHGGLNLEPKAFQGQGSYPAQVRFAVYRECLPVPESVFKGVIEENYYAWNKFHHELTSAQVSKLVQLFRPIEATRKRLLVDGAMQEAGGHRLDLLERTIPAPGGVELANRFPQYRLPAPGIRLEERVPRLDPGLRLEPRPLAADAVERAPLPQMRVLDGRPDQKDLLSQGRLEEVDQLALKYLQQGTPNAGRPLNPLHRNAAMEAARTVPPSLQQEAILRSRALEAERLRRAAVEQAFLREQGSSLPGASSSRAGMPFAATRPEPVALSALSRQPVDIRRRR
ncbi:hypothetical protein GOP47_0018576 [Adiantum capillus-veneris]|uniref:DCD domain-containing protein n=1 Tax=Adiantum capillus-veneris TaxID=13818 RepID=A0A9D4UE25_ADICA|nr:hypothetical protein GOP47_0018576 [Adiantum capillus-veneris]